MHPAAIFEDPYYAVIFTSLRTDGDSGYGAMAEEMERLSSLQPGFLGIESARDGSGSGGLGITVSYWRSLEDVHAWKANLDHLEAQRRGKENWYSRYTVRVTKVEYNYAVGA